MYERLGEDYISKSFAWARQYAPTGTLLVLNDANMLLEGISVANADVDPRWLDQRTPRFQKNLEVARKLKQQGVCDGLGFQLHINAALPTFPDEVRSRLQAVVREGLVAVVTEFDVRVDEFAGNTNQKFQRQAELFEFWTEMLYRYGGCRMFNTFGLNDSNSWYVVDRSPSVYRPNAYATLLDDNFKPKPSYDRLVALLEKLLAEKQKRK